MAIYVVWSFSIWVTVQTYRAFHNYLERWVVWYHCLWMPVSTLIVFLIILESSNHWNLSPSKVAITWRHSMVGSDLNFTYGIQSIRLWIIGWRGSGHISWDKKSLLFLEMDGSKSLIQRWEEIGQSYPLIVSGTGVSIKIRF